MPTPFYHLSVAEDLLDYPGLGAETRDLLLEYRPAFLLGNTAPDVQTVSGQDRTETHFFDLPIRPGMQPAWEQLMDRHPSLGRAHGLAPAQAAFLAGYLCHLQADWLWVIHIFAPVFGPRAGWQSFRHRLYLHNVLRAYLDQEILKSFTPSVGASLEQVSPLGWLPFVRDIYLRQWRDLLARQLQPGARVETVQVFAARQGISPETFYRFLNSEERLDEEIFARVPRKALQEYRQGLLKANVLLLQEYLESAAHP